MSNQALVSPFRRASMFIAGASRGLGCGMANEFLGKGWDVVGTARTQAASELHSLANHYPDRLAIEMLDVTDLDQIRRVRARLQERRFDILFVNAGTITENEHVLIGDVTTDEFNRVMLTNALGPMRVIEWLQDLVTASGLIGVMSSSLGSLTNNTTGRREVYRSSKAAVNMLLRSFSNRPNQTNRSFVVMSPGWVRTALGGPDAELSVEESAFNVVNVLISRQHKPGITYLDYLGRALPW